MDMRRLPIHRVARDPRPSVTATRPERSVVDASSVHATTVAAASHAPSAATAASHATTMPAASHATAHITNHSYYVPPADLDMASPLALTSISVSPDGPTPHPSVPFRQWVDANRHRLPPMRQMQMRAPSYTQRPPLRVPYLTPSSVPTVGKDDKVKPSDTPVSHCEFYPRDAGLRLVRYLLGRTFRSAICSRAEIAQLEKEPMCKLFAHLSPAERKEADHAYARLNTSRASKSSRDAHSHRMTADESESTGMATTAAVASFASSAERHVDADVVLALPIDLWTMIATYAGIEGGRIPFFFLHLDPTCAGAEHMRVLTEMLNVPLAQIHEDHTLAWRWSVLKWVDEYLPLPPRIFVYARLLTLSEEAAAKNQPQRLSSCRSSVEARGAAAHSYYMLGARLRHEGAIEKLISAWGPTLASPTEAASILTATIPVKELIEVFATECASRSAQIYIKENPALFASAVPNPPPHPAVAPEPAAHVQRSPVERLFSSNRFITINESGYYTLPATTMPVQSLDEIAESLRTESYPNDPTALSGILEREWTWFLNLVTLIQSSASSPAEQRRTNDLINTTVARWLRAGERNGLVAMWMIFRVLENPTISAHFVTSSDDNDRSKSAGFRALHQAVEIFARFERQSDDEELLLSIRSRLVRALFDAYDKYRALLAGDSMGCCYMNISSENMTRLQTHLPEQFQEMTTLLRTLFHGVHDLDSPLYHILLERTRTHSPAARHFLRPFQERPLAHPTTGYFTRPPRSSWTILDHIYAGFVDAWYREYYSRSRLLQANLANVVHICAKTVADWTVLFDSENRSSRDTSSTSFLRECQVVKSAVRENNPFAQAILYRGRPSLELWFRTTHVLSCQRSTRYPVDGSLAGDSYWMLFPPDISHISRWSDSVLFPAEFGSDLNQMYDMPPPMTLGRPIPPYLVAQPTTYGRIPPYLVTRPTITAVAAAPAPTTAPMPLPPLPPSPPPSSDTRELATTEIATSTDAYRGAHLRRRTHDIPVSPLHSDPDEDDPGTGADDDDRHTPAESRRLF